jgi:tetratricopeptide (TPR) repeat protein
LGDDEYLTRLMEFDVAMELGNRYRARAVLNNLADKKCFEYLIREAKYKDHVAGDLEAAIELMEQAREEVTTIHQPALHTWVTSNLGDLYGHANRYAESYRCYLQALEKDPDCYHALKGIAWLAFSHDNDVAQAKKILAYLQEQHPVPDYELLLAEIADYENDTLAQQYHQHTFMRTVQIVAYGDMYNKYLFNLQATEPGHQQQLLQIAQREVQNRPTAEAYSWLAWAYCANGDMQKAMETIRLRVQNKCFEPDALYYMGLIYRAGGNKEAARKYLSEAKKSAYELGPGTTAHIQQLLNNL